MGGGRGEAAAETLVRDRLLRDLQRRPRIVVVVAPAGSGKTTLLAQAARSLHATSACYDADPGDGDGRRLLEHVLGAADRAASAVEESGATVDGALAALEAACRTRAVVVAIDNAHVLEGTSAEAALERLTLYSPQGVTLLVASRHQLRINLSRLRLADDLIELDGEDLRFRSWEVERLFREQYHQLVTPEELAELARRTEGWAAGLQLFHLATRGKPGAERRRVLAGLSRRSRLVREYLAQNVIEDLCGELRAFLVDSCVLGRLSGPLCDEALGRAGSGAMLSELEHRQIFVSRVDEEGTCRYHEVLRSYLEAILVDQVGEQAVRTRFARAAAALEHRGFRSDALRAYCRAESWDSVRRLAAASRGKTPDDAATSWVEAVPANLLREDPWLTLAAARRQLGAGHPSAALELYGTAERGFGLLGAAETCRKERLAVAPWVDPTATMRDDFSGLLRKALRDEPAAVAEEAQRLAWPERVFVQGVCALLGGRTTAALDTFLAVADDPGASPALEAGARLAGAVAAALVGDPGAASALGAAQESADRVDIPWLSHLIQSAITSATASTGLTRLRRAGLDEPWSVALEQLFDGLWVAEPHSRRMKLLAAAEAFGALEAPTLRRWATAAAGALSDDQDPAQLSAHRHPLVRVRCFGQFSITVGEAALSLAPVRPRARALLRFLAVHAPTAIHREELIDTLWPDADLRAGTRSLQVAVSSLRQLLDPLLGYGDHSAVAREGEAYRLVLPPEAEIDTVAFDALLTDAQRAAESGDDHREARLLEHALALYAGDLLTSDGPCDWVVKERDRYRVRAADTAYALAETYLRRDMLDAASNAAQRGLMVDRYRDGLWRLLISAQERSGEVAARAATRRAYDEMLAELGLGPTATSTGDALA